MEDKKKRSPNYTVQEKALLLNILHNFKHIIENKKTDSQTWKDKEIAWEDIATIFNSQCPESYVRSKESLKKYYDNIKKNVRKVVAKEKFEKNKTGGGYEDKVENDGTFDLALGLMNPKTVFGLNNEFDGDAETEDVTFQIIGSCSGNDTNDSIYEMEQHVELQSSSQITEKPVQITNNEESVSPMANWSNMNPSKLKRPLSKKLMSPLTSSWAPRRRPSLQQPSSSKLAEEYSEVAKLKLELFQAEKEDMAIKRKREEELFLLTKKKLLLDIQLKQLEVKKFLIQNPNLN